MGKQVGVIIPIYNVASYLKQCLDSVMNQTYEGLRVVLVNDGSKDESLEIAKEYVLKDSRFILIDKVNGGQSSARNVGIKYFKNAFSFREVCQNTFSIQGENPFAISRIYSLAPPPQ